jgi:virginiamycin B lyase
MRRLILGVALLAIIVGAATLGFAAGGHATSARAAAPVHLYWANDTPLRGAIGRALLDGSGVEHSFVSGAGRFPCGVALDRKHIYWAELQGGAIGRANRDGSAVNASFIPTPGTGDCGVAIAGGHIYWATVDHGTIGRANLDGTGVEQQFIPGLAIPSTHSTFSNGGGPCGIAVAGKYIYWINFVEGLRSVAIGRANLDGTGINKRFIPGRPANGCGIAVAGGYIYWTNGGFVKSRYAIGRANLDGTGVNHRFIRTAGLPCGVAVYHGHIYWGEWWPPAHPITTIGRANLDGSAVTNHFITGIHDLCGGALGSLAIG